MISVQVQVAPECVMTCDVQTIKQAFEYRAACDELFGVKKCGHCDSENLRPKVRTALKDGKVCTFYSIECRDCGYEFKFGQKQAAGAPLFPKGWEPPYQRQTQEAAQPQSYDGATSYNAPTSSDEPIPF